MTAKGRCASWAKGGNPTLALRQRMMRGCVGSHEWGYNVECQNRCMRQKPSAADIELIDELLSAPMADEASALELSAAKLERWRYLGLIPRVKVERTQFGGTHVPPHSAEVVEAVRLLAQTSRRGRPWQLTAERLFNAGFPLTDRALQGTASYLMRAEVVSMKRAWAAAEAEAPRTRGAAARGAEIGQRAVEKLPRFLKTAVRNEMMLVHGAGADRVDIDEVAERALIWRMVDFAMKPDERKKLTKRETNLARHGVEDPMLGLGGLGLLPLPSERAGIAETLTWAEVAVYRTFGQLRIGENAALERLGLFTVTTWVVASERVNTPPHDPTTVVSTSHLAEVARMLT